MTSDLQEAYRAALGLASMAQTLPQDERLSLQTDLFPALRGSLEVRKAAVEKLRQLAGESRSMAVPQTADQEPYTSV